MDIDNFNDDPSPSPITNKSIKSARGSGLKAAGPPAIIKGCIESR